MADVIDRKAILKHIEKIRQGVLMMDDTHRASIIMNGMHLCEEAVRNQPSAQPEIIRCKDCEHYWASAELCTKWTRHCGGMGYCDDAERITDG